MPTGLGDDDVRSVDKSPFRPHEVVVSTDTALLDTAISTVRTSMSPLRSDPTARTTIPGGNGYGQ